jgi:hypothetical protein
MKTPALPSNTTISPLLRLTGLAFLLTPFLLQIPYTLLALQFNYPAILRQPASQILTQYAAGGPGLSAIWYLFGILILPLLLAQSLLPELITAQKTALLQAATKLGILSAILQIVGLLRWVFAVPYLAATYAQATPAEKPALEALFQIQHQLLGVMIGEHLGQILLALWTLGVVFALPSPNRIQQAFGILGAALFLLGSAEIAFPALAPIAGIAFLVWSVWCALLGFTLLRHSAETPAA